MIGKRRKLMHLDDRGPLRTMFIVTSMPVGGLETLLVNLMRRVDRSRIEPELCFLKSLGPLGVVIARADNGRGLTTAGSPWNSETENCACGVPMANDSLLAEGLADEPATNPTTVLPSTGLAARSTGSERTERFMPIVVGLFVARGCAALI